MTQARDTMVPELSKFGRRPGWPNQRTVHTLAAVVAAATDISTEELFSDGRFAILAWARASVYRQLTDLGFSLKGIAAVFGIDHTTVICGLRMDVSGLPPKFSKEFLAWRKKRAAAATMPTIPIMVPVYRVAAPYVSTIKAPTQAQRMGRK